MAGLLIVVAKSVGSSLASYALEYATKQLLLSWGLETEVQKIKGSMETINAVLRDVEEREGGITTNNSDQLWLSKLCNALYDIDDVLDVIVTMAERKKLMEGNAFLKEVKIFCSSYNQLITSISLAQRIKSIRENLDDIAKDKSDYASGSHYREVGRQVQNNYLSINVVGRENEKNELISMLLDSKFEDNVRVIPIVGPVGGLGKSTLASYVFNDRKVKENFKNLHLWVPLLQDTSLGGVMQKIVDVANEQQNDKDSGWNKGTTSTQGSDLEQLKVCLRGIINGKKYILVLDNVWNESIVDWRDLESLLTVGAIHGSRILLTTRSPIIAKNMGSGKSLELQPLGDDHSWSLLESIVFGKNGCRDLKLKEIGLKILPMCYNVPLALRALAGVLATNVSVNFWSKFKRDDPVSNLGLHGEEHNIIPILKLSYDYLRPSALKSCFSYCSLFPKGHEFDKNKLVILWIAQGFVAPLHEGGHLSLEEEGTEYMNMLVYKGLLQDVPNDESHISTCKLHDLMYELSCSISANQCKTLNANEDSNIERNIRHVSINYNVDRPFKIPHLQSDKQVRTFLLTTESAHDEEGCLNFSLFKSLMKSFFCLRVLDLHGLGIVQIPKYIVNLMHLRYLDLSDNAFKRLPNSITSLYNLQYLNLIGMYLTELPNDMDKLVNLSHLLVDSMVLGYFPSGLDKLTNLHTLTLFIAGCKENGRYKGPFDVKPNCGRLSDLKCLNHLRGDLRIVIGFYKNIGSDAKEANLKGKKNIKRLRLEWEMDRACYDEDEMVFEYLQPHNQISELCIVSYKGKKMPTWMSTTQITSSLQNLTSLTICNCDYITHVPSFSRLLFLKSLKLGDLRAVEYIERSVDEYGSTSSETVSSSSTVFFPSLSKIHIRWLPNLKGWREHGEENLIFPCVSEVSLSGWMELESLPSCPNVKTLTLSDGELCLNAWRALTSLRSLELRNCETLKVLPSGIAHLTMLQSLVLFACDELEAIPYWIGNLRSLSTLRIYNCEGLTSLPEEIAKLTQLKMLTVYECSQLEPRLKKNVGEDWHKIQHIQQIDID